MASLNKIQLIGNLGRDPEMRTFSNGGQVANTSIACSERWRDKASGEQREHVEWVNLTFNDKLAEIASQYLRKGSQIYVEGRLRTRKWQDQSGQDRYTTEVRVDNLQMLGGRQDGNGGNGGSQPPRQQQSQPPRQQHGQPPRQAQHSQAPRQQSHNQGAPAAYGDGSGFDDVDGDIPF